MFNFGNANTNQKEAIQTTDGPVLIIAGPGTGKTFTLVKRALYLIVEKHISPEDILIATFTEKAAKELITRLSNELISLDYNVNLNDMYVGTIHSICLRFIKEHLEYTSLKKDYRIIDDFEQKYLVYQHVKEFRDLPNSNLIFGEKTGGWTIAETVCYYANAVSEELVDLNELFLKGSEEVKVVADIIKKYRDILNLENALDFSSIQSVAYQMLLDNKEVCESLQNKIKYIMIDEYQDTNYVQEQLIVLLGKKHNNICVVGDDDQGLYRFRGATIRNILEFPDKFPDCKKFILNENYRSETNIIDFYNNWMHTTYGDDFNFDWDRYRFNKNIIPSKSKLISSVPTVLKVSGEKDVDSWKKNILLAINCLKDSGKLKDYNQIAFLFKSVRHPSVIELEDYLEKNGIQVYSPRSNLFFNRKEIKLLIGALIFLFPSYVKKLQDSKMYLSPELEEYYISCVQAFNIFLKEPQNSSLSKWCKYRAIDHMQKFENFDYAFSGLIYQLFQFEPFNSILSTDISSGVIDTRPIRNLAKFNNLVVKYEFIHRTTIFTVSNLDYTVERFFNTYLRFLFDGGISEYEDDAEYAPHGCVSFMTIHQSKGLEFPIVFVGSLFGVPRKDQDDIISILEKNFYHRKPYEPIDLIKYYDFWRLYYTAFSRAQNLLILTAKENEGRSSDPSRYFKDLYKLLPSFNDSNIDFNNYYFEPVKEVNIKQTYSFTSNISVYETCSIQYKFFKELGFEAVRTGQTLFGTLVHHTIEDIHKAAIRGDISSINEANVQNWFNINYEAICQKEHDYLDERVKKAALRQVLNYVSTNSNHWDKIKAAEIEVSHVEPNFILMGKVDLVSGDGDTVEIIDFKSEKKPDIITDRDKLERYHRQLEIYAYIIEHKFGLKVSKMHLYYTGTENSSPWISYDYKNEEIQEAIRGFSSIVDKIQNKEFNCATNSLKSCRGCDFKYYCGRD